VVDTGAGIAPDKQCSIWEPFVSMDGSTGLGLFVVQKQCAAIHGECGLNARADGLHGCEFWWGIFLDVSFLDSILTVGVAGSRYRM
jgi:signal transduction histidine kinase